MSDAVVTASVTRTLELAAKIEEEVGPTHRRAELRHARLLTTAHVMAELELVKATVIPRAIGLADAVHEGDTARAALEVLGRQARAVLDALDAAHPVQVARAVAELRGGVEALEKDRPR